ncbi:MAG TPA: hypothetical protein VFC63_04510 [Blastocatellia bacterium]|nr:hypothetical protein [Blastocatellia bacterium]
MSQQLEKIKTLEELKGHSIEDLLHEVLRNQEAITVTLEEGEAVLIQPAKLLKPLPELDGRVPEGWKDAIYGQ